MSYCDKKTQIFLKFTRRKGASQVCHGKIKPWKFHGKVKGIKFFKL